MTQTTGKRAVECDDYAALYDYVSAGLRELDDDEDLTFLYQDEGEPGGLDESSSLEADDLRMLLSTLPGGMG